MDRPPPDEPTVVAPSEEEMAPPTPDPEDRRSAGGDRRSPAVASIRPTRITRALAVTAVILVALSVAGQVVRYTTGHDYAKGFIPLFHVSTEQNIPSYFSALILLFAASLLAVVGWGEARDDGSGLQRYWLGLASIFALLSVDEAAAIHERTMDPLREALGVGGLFYFAWVIPGFVFVTLVAAWIVPFLRNLPRRTYRLFLLAALLFVGGALGMELLGGLVWEREAGRSATLSVLTTTEESMEMAGVIVFIHGLLLHLRDRTPEIRLRLEPTPIAAGDGRANERAPGEPPDPSGMGGKVAAQ